MNFQPILTTMTLTLLHPYHTLTHGVDVSSHEVTLAWVQEEVLSPEGHNPGVRAAAGELGHTV